MGLGVSYGNHLRAGGWVGCRASGVGKREQILGGCDQRWDVWMGAHNQIVRGGVVEELHRSKVRVDGFGFKGGTTNVSAAAFWLSAQHS